MSDVGLQQHRHVARRFPIRPGDDQHTAGDGRGLAVSLKRLFQDQLIQRQIRDRLPETAILPLQVLQTLGLVSTKAAIFLAPAIVTLLRYAERATSLTNGLALRQGHLGFAQHADNLFWGVAFTAHFVLLSRGQNAPNSLKTNLDHF